VPSENFKARVREQASGSSLGSSFAFAAPHEGWSQQRWEEVRNDQPPFRAQHSGAFSDASLLIGPVVKRSCRHDQVERSVGVGQFLDGTSREFDPSIKGMLTRHVEHRASRIDPNELYNVRAPGGEQP
jgi:hypothetical protein